MTAKANWTYRSEEAMWNTAQPQLDLNKMARAYALSKEPFHIIQERFTAEYSQFKAFLDGTLNLPADTYFGWSKCKLFYLDFPEIFERDIDRLEVELDTTDKAWIANTRKLIKKYFVICMDERTKLWPQNAECNAEEVKRILAVLPKPEKPKNETLKTLRSNAV